MSTDNDTWLSQITQIFKSEKPRKFEMTMKRRNPLIPFDLTLISQNRPFQQIIKNSRGQAWAQHRIQAKKPRRQGTQKWFNREIPCRPGKRQQ